TVPSQRCASKGMRVKANASMSIARPPSAMQVLFQPSTARRKERFKSLNTVARALCAVIPCSSGPPIGKPASRGLARQRAAYRNGTIMAWFPMRRVQLPCGVRGWHGDRKGCRGRGSFNGRNGDALPTGSSTAIQGRAYRYFAAVAGFPVRGIQLDSGWFLNARGNGEFLDHWVTVQVDGHFSFTYRSRFNHLDIAVRGLWEGRGWLAASGEQQGCGEG